MTKLQKRLKELRGTIPQREIADKLGISRERYGHYETGRNEPDNETLQKIAEFYLVSVDYLLGRTDVPNYEDNISIAFKDGEDDLTEEERKEAYRIFKQMKKTFGKDEEDK